MRGNRDDPIKRKAISETLPLIFRAIDTNSDGQIEYQEFQNYFESFGVIDNTFTKFIFKSLDLNHNLYLCEKGIFLIIKNF